MRAFLCGLTSAVLAGAACQSSAADWPHWRGRERSDVVAESSGWDGKEWPLGEAAWKANLGDGSSSPIVAGGRLYGIGWADNKDTVTCLDARSGKVVWQASYASPQYGRRSTGDKGIYSGATATPAFDEVSGLLFTLGIDGDLGCWDTRQQGRRVWGLNLYDEYDVKQRPNVGKGREMLRDYGYVGSPFVSDELVIVEVGDDEGLLMAFDKASGKRRWVSQCKDEAGHAGGLSPLMVEQVPCVAVLSLRNLVVVRIDGGHAGETVAEYLWTTDFGNNIPTPAVHGDSVIITSAYNQYAMCRVRISLGGAKRVWQQDNPSGVCSPVIHDGRVYWAWRGVHCIDFETGKELWAGGKVGSAGSCIATSDGRLVVWSDNGDLSLIETAKRSPKKYRELAARRNLLQTDAWPHVVLAGGRLYCKDRAGNLLCYAIGQQADPDD